MLGNVSFTNMSTKDLNKNYKCYYWMIKYIKSKFWVECKEKDKVNLIEILQ